MDERALTSVVDSHLHVWDLESDGYGWLGPQHGELFRSYGPDEAERQLALAGVQAAVLVQADDSEADTRLMLDVADKHSFVVGVVGWVALEEPERVVEQLADYGSHPAFRGVRQLVHDDPRDDVLDLPAVRRSLAILAEHGLPFDVPDAWPRHLPGLAQLADALPDLTLVVDHLGKPPRGSDDLDAWARAFREVGRRPNTVAKVSGLQMSGQPFTIDALRPVWELALEVYGPSRLMYGGDWPMTVPTGGYQPHWEVVSELIGELTADQQADLLHQTASDVYGIEVADAR
jgi:L-fuconolactonase